MRFLRLAGLLFVAAVVSMPAPAAAQRDEEPVVRAVLFFSPTCGHCEFVIQQVLPGVFADNGGTWQVFFDETAIDRGVPYFLLSNGRFEVLLVDVTLEEGFGLFEDSSASLAIDSGAVPRLVISNQVMIGSQAIPERLPGVVAAGLEGEGIDWPELPGLDAALATIPPVAVLPATDSDPEAAAEPEPEAPAVDPNPAEVTTAVAGLPIDTGTRFGRDPLANSIAVVVLAGMLMSLGGAVVMAVRHRSRERLGRAIPLMALAGVAVAVYLSVLEIGSVEGVCGPIGDCNTVQQSPYARVLGIPVGIIGVVGYLLMLSTWFVQRSAGSPIAERARVLLLVGSVIGVGFSIYLTALEPFVIGASCAWCLTSAVIVTLVMLLSVEPAVTAWRFLRGTPMQMRLELQ